MRPPSASPPDLAGAVRAAAARYAMWRSGDGVLVAVSGGLDSVTLLDVLVRVAAADGLKVVVAHFDHGLRGAEGQADADFVSALASGHGLPFVLGAGDVEAEAKALGRGVEAAARRLRLAFLADAAAARSCSAVALAHTADDRAETVLLNLLRGSGLWGLQGMPAVRQPFVRPFLSVWRSDVEAHAAAAGLSWRVDSTNLDTSRFLRNKIRHELLPLLEAEYHAGAADALARCAAAVEAELAWSDAHVAAALRAAAPEVGDGAIFVRVAPLAPLPDGLLVRVLRAAATSLLGDVADWSFDHYAALLDLVRDARTGRRAALPAGVEARVAYGVLRLGAPVVRPQPLPARLLPVPGEVHLPELGLVLRARLVSRDEAPHPGANLAVFDSRFADALTVRGWQPGDRFVPSGMTGAKKLQDFFTDEKLPAEIRPLVPLVIHPLWGILWVVGMRIAAAVGPPADSPEALVISAVAPGGAGGRLSEADGEA
jgi:tRNA(Ile)-lysidine synthase